MNALPYLIFPLAILATLLNVIDILGNLSTKSILHHDLAKKFIEIEIALSIDAISVEEAQKERLKIEANKPPIKYVLNAIMYNNESRAEGYKSRTRLSKIQTAFAQFFDYRPETIELIEPIEVAEA